MVIVFTMRIRSLPYVSSPSHTPYLSSHGDASDASSANDTHDIAAGCPPSTPTSLARTSRDGVSDNLRESRSYAKGGAV